MPKVKRHQCLTTGLCWLEKEIATHSSILTWRIPWTVYGVTKSWTRLSDFHFTSGLNQPVKSIKLLLYRFICQKFNTGLTGTKVKVSASLSSFLQFRGESLTWTFPLSRSFSHSLAHWTPFFHVQSQKQKFESFHTASLWNLFQF